MQLKKDDKVKFTVWVNNTLVIDNNSEVYTAVENDDTFFIYVKDANGKEVKIKMENITEAVSPK